MGSRSDITSVIGSVSITIFGEFRVRDERAWDSACYASGPVAIAGH